MNVCICYFTMYQCVCICYFKVIIVFICEIVLLHCSTRARCVLIIIIIGNTLFGLGDGCRRQDMAQKVPVSRGCKLTVFKIFTRNKTALIYEKPQEVHSPVSASFIAERSGPVKTCTNRMCKI